MHAHMHVCMYACNCLLACVLPQFSVSAPKPPRQFLSLFLIRHHASSRDIVLKRVLLEIDDLEVDIDADMLNGLNVGGPQRVASTYTQQHTIHHTPQRCCMQPRSPTQQHTSLQHAAMSCSTYTSTLECTTAQTIKHHKATNTTVCNYTTPIPYITQRPDTPL